MAGIAEIYAMLRDDLPCALSGETLKNPGYMDAVLSSVARYETGAASIGQRIDHFLNAPRSQWYDGDDTLQSQEEEARYSRMVATWGDMMTPMSFNVTQLERTAGITNDQLVNSIDINRVSNIDPKAFYSEVEARATATLYGANLDLTKSLWGYFDDADNVMRAPQSLQDVFSETKTLHGGGPDELGDSWDSRHPLSREDFPGWQKPWVPFVWYFNHTDGKGGKPADGTAAKTLTRENIFEIFDDWLSIWDLYVRGKKYLPMPQRLFTMLSGNSRIVNNGYEFTANIMDGMGWSYQVKVIEMHNVRMFAEPNAPKDELYGMHLGERGARNGTLFPVFWEPASANAARAQLDKYLREAQAAVPMGLPNPVRTQPLPFYMDNFGQIPTKANAVGANMRLKYMWVCNERWCQALGKGFEIGNTESV